MKRNEGRFGLGIVVGLVLLMSMFSLRVIPTPAEAAIVAQWTSASPLNDTHAQAVIVQDGDGLVYVIGGVNSMSYDEINNVSSYDPDTGQWRDLAPLPHAARGSAGAYFDGKIYVFGGADSITGPLSYTQIYDIAANSWSSGTAVPQAVWEGKAGVSSSGKIYIFGGERPASAYSNVVNIYDIALDSWSLGVNMPVGVKAGAVVSMGYYFYYIGGVTATGTTAAVNVYYDWGSWDSPPPASLPRATAALAAVRGADGLIYAFGGGLGISNTGAGYNYSYYYNTWEDSWYDGPNMTMESRYLGGAATDDGRILALGGNNAAEMFSKVDSMRIMSVSSSVAPTTVASGRPVLVTVSADFANVVPEYYYGSADLVSGTGVSYSSTSFNGIFDVTFAFQMNIPEGIPAGAYTIVLPSVEIEYSNGGTDLAERRLSVTVVVGETLDQQMISLQNQIANLTAQLAAADGNVTMILMTLAQLGTMFANLQTQLNAMQDQVDRIEDKADTAGLYAMINVVLVIIILVLLVLMFVMSRRKP